MRIHIVLLVIAGFIVLPLNSQTYDALVDTTKKWNVVTSMDCPGTCQKTTIFKLKNDTMINGKSYFQLFRSFDTISPTYYSQDFYLREDTDEGEVYYLSDGKPERLLYDFSINQYDTITINNKDCIQSVVATKVDTINYNGTNRKRIEFANEENETLTEYWIEGIGSTSGIIHTVMNNCVIDAITNLLCVFQNGSQIYMNPDFNSCYMSTVYTQSTNRPPPLITVSPNPIQDYSELSISGTENLNYKMEIVDIMGRSHFSEIIDSQSTYVIRRSDFESGLYVAILFIDNRLVESIKIQII